jgi:hypothetical protein
MIINSETSGSKGSVSCSAGDQIQSVTHARQALYHQATIPGPSPKNLRKKIVYIILFQAERGGSSLVKQAQLYELDFQQR